MQAFESPNRIRRDFFFFLGNHIFCFYADFFIIMFCLSIMLLMLIMK